MGCWSSRSSLYIKCIIWSLSFTIINCWKWCCLDENIDDKGEIHDDFRVHYIEEHLKNVNAAIEDGVDCRGYLYWGPIDVVSAGTGEMKKRYGFVYVDRFNDGHGTLERKLKDSYYRYKEIIESNGEVLLEDK